MQALPPDEDRDAWELRSQLITRWAELEPNAAAAFAREKMRNFFGDVLSVWAAQDREAAKSFVAGIKDKDLLLEILPGFTRTLAESDLEDALRFATALPADPFHNSIRLAFYGAGQKNPAAAAARALAMPEGDARGSAISAAAEVWLEANPQAAMAWVMQRPDTAIGDCGNLFQSAIQSWSSNDPAGASRFVQSMPAGKQRELGLKSVAQHWAFKDIGSAVQWVQSLPEDKAKTEALGSVLSQWSYEDPPAVAAFLAGQPAVAKTGELLAAIGEKWAKRDPAAALAWAAGAAERSTGKERRVGGIRHARRG
ncbi:MAG: hypothetical protein QOE70_2598 [Chthoniobacter sp.]|nr:hypothetical protein [Chthoniobacter sp.]